MSDELRPTLLLWSGHAGLARHDGVELKFSRWPGAVLPGIAVIECRYIPVTREFELRESAKGWREMSRTEMTSVYSWLKGLAEAGHRYFDGP